MQDLEQARPLHRVMAARTPFLAVAGGASLRFVMVLSVAGCAAGPETKVVEKETTRKVPKTGTVATPKPDTKIGPSLVWKSTKPTFITLTRTATGTEDAPAFSVTYSPEPPDVQMELAPAPGAPAFTMMEAVLTWTIQPKEGKAFALAPETIPIPPFKVAPAPIDSEGQLIYVQVPLSVGTLKPYFTEPDPAKRATGASGSLQLKTDDVVIHSQGAPDVPLSLPVTVKLEEPK